jgi:hypothetical protein
MTSDNSDRKIINEIFTNVLKEGHILKSYQQCLELKVFELENGVTLLIISGIPLLNHKVQVTK